MCRFVEYMMDEHLKKLNRIPFELRIHGPGRALFPRADYDGFLRHIASPEALSRVDEEPSMCLLWGHQVVAGPDLSTCSSTRS